MEFKENEEIIFQQTIEWLTSKSFNSSVLITQQLSEFQINPFTRSVVNKNGELLFLTSKEFDLLYFFYSHKGQVFTKEQLYENVWGFEDMPKDTSNLPSFIRKLRKKIEPEYSCAVTPQVRQTGNRLSGPAGTAYASLLT